MAVASFLLLTEDARKRQWKCGKHKKEKKRYEKCTRQAQTIFRLAHENSRMAMAKSTQELCNIKFVEKETICSKECSCDNTK
ncbi:CLUMA_CG001187, isoform A [Clunio marinus]|uniref:CLUMA_CG001187, isoform A n=1 Tax=Clunio marinus TaxID=568069 RepID=A0A1J1HMC6_9DIPT|nr:CLUMA_CG001187, isoform A [Clunio marinus]